MFCGAYSSGNVSDFLSEKAMYAQLEKVRLCSLGLTSVVMPFSG